MSSADADRLALGPAAVFRITRAAALLPFDEKAGVAWLRARSLVRRVEVPHGDTLRTVEVVVWADVLAELRGERTTRKPTRARGGNVPWLDPDEP